MEIQILQLVVPSALTIIGWFVAATWAIEQVKTAHEKNIALQRELLNESHRRDTARELIEIYKSVTQSANRLQQAISMFWLNHTIERSGELDGVNIKAHNLIIPINESYNATAQVFVRLEMWLKVTGDQVSDVSILNDAIADFYSAFTVSGVAVDKRVGAWAGYQGLLVTYQSGKEISEQKLESYSREITEAIISLIKKLADGTTKINRGLCGAMNNA